MTFRPYTWKERRPACRVGSDAAARQRKEIRHSVRLTGSGARKRPSHVEPALCRPGRGRFRVMSADEEGTLARLKAHRRELIDPKIAEHRGRIVKTTGDGMLVEFSSVVDAVRCEVEVAQHRSAR